MLVGFWRAVVSLLGGFPALRDAAGTKGERVRGVLPRAYRNWQLILCCTLLCVPASSPFLAALLSRTELFKTWIFTTLGYKSLGGTGIRAQRSRRHGVPICEEQAEGRAGYGQKHQGFVGEAA